eukprot:gene9958-3121_t
MLVASLPEEAEDEEVTEEAAAEEVTEEAEDEEETEEVEAEEDPPCLIWCDVTCIICKVNGTVEHNSGKKSTKFDDSD